MTVSVFQIHQEHACGLAGSMTRADSMLSSDVAPGLHANEEEDGTITDPESLLDVLNDCSQASNCWALRGKPER